MSLKLLMMFFVIYSGFGIISAQYALVPAGGGGSGAGGSISFSLGQIAYTNAAGNAGSLSSGVQQTYEIIEITRVAQTDAMLISVFPTHVKDVLSVEIETEDFSMLEFRVFDLNGKLIRSGKIKNRLTEINVGNLLQSTYLIEVFKNDMKSGSYKFIKVQ